MIKNVSPAEAQLALSTRNNIKLIDVRESWEYELVSIPGSEHFPLSEFMNHSKSLPPDGTYYLLCHHGSRSLNACVFLSMNGFKNLYNVEGGIHRWSEEVDKSLPQY